MSLSRFKFTKPITLGEHAEYSHLLSFLEESIDDLFRGKQDIYDLKAEIEIARVELDEVLNPLLKGHQRRTKILSIEEERVSMEGRKE